MTALTDEQTRDILDFLMVRPSSCPMCMSPWRPADRLVTLSVALPADVGAAERALRPADVLASFNCTNRDCGHVSLVSVAVRQNSPSWKKYEAQQLRKRAREARRPLTPDEEAAVRKAEALTV